MALLARQSTFNAVIQDIAVKNNTRFVDIYSFMKSYGADYLISSDGLHPNETGYAVIARGMIEAVRTF
jgi:lysophospholipase L1-like esterase